MSSQTRFVCAFSPWPGYIGQILVNCAVVSFRNWNLVFNNVQLVSVWFMFFVVLPFKWYHKICRQSHLRIAWINRLEARPTATHTLKCGVCGHVVYQWT